VHAVALMTLPPGQASVERWLDVLVAVAVVAAVVRTLAIRQARLVDRLAQEARVDPLTGLLNRRGFDERLGLELARAARDHTWLTVVRFDVDHFKQVNDTHGHDAADRVLAWLGRAVTEHIRGVAAGRARPGRRRGWRERRPRERRGPVASREAIVIVASGRFRTPWAAGPCSADRVGPLAQAARKLWGGGAHLDDDVRRQVGSAGGGDDGVRRRGLVEAVRSPAVGTEEGEQPAHALDAAVELIDQLHIVRGQIELLGEAALDHVQRHRIKC
jgi:hypothetical protein